MGKKTTMLVGSLVVWLAGAGAHAAPPYEEAARNLPASLVAAGKQAKNLPYPRLDTRLNRLLAEEEKPGLVQALGLRESSGQVQVHIESEPGRRQELESWLAAQGAQRILVAGDAVEAFVSRKTLEQLAQHSAARFVRTPSYYRPAPWERSLGARALVGSLTTEALAAMNVPAWHSAGIQGQGVKVGVIDSGFKGYQSLLGSDLPPASKVFVWPQGAGSMERREHGTMCAEIVTDIAPQLDGLYLAATRTEVDIVNAIQWMQSQGVKVITMSMGWLSWGPGDGTGTLASAVNSFVAAGGFWANSAGNSRLAHWQGNFQDSNGNGWLDFDGTGLEVNFITTDGVNCGAIPAGTEIYASLVWNQWNAPATDLDFYILKWNESTQQWTVLGKSEDPQTGQPGQRPVEENFDVWVADEETCYGFAIRYYAGPSNVQLEFFNRFDGNPLRVNVQEGSLTPPADASGAVAVAALHVATLGLEPYSSKGPTNGPGGALTGGSTKPDLAGYAQVSCNAYGSGQCSGTSAASPHVAGAAALAASGYPSYNGSQIRSYLESNAQDMGPSGKDTDYGWGRLRLGSPPASGCTAPGTPTGLAASKSSVVSGESFTLSWSAAFLAEDYELQFATNAAFSGAQSYTVSGTSTSFQVTTSSNVTAFFRVRARRSCGATSNWSNTVQVSVSASGGGGGDAYQYWIPVVANAPGNGGTYFYSDVSVLNVGNAPVTVNFAYSPTSGGTFTGSSQQPLPVGGQGIFRDVVGQLNKVGTKGVLRVSGAQPLKVISRTYNKLAAGNSLGLAAGTTFGQYIEAYPLTETLGAGQVAYLVGLTQNGAYRTNIAVANFGSTVASVTVYLYSGTGQELASYAVSLNPGQLQQVDEAFKVKAGQSNLESGWAKVVVNAGSGVVAYASVLDNTATNNQKPSDPTTIPFKR